MKLETNSSGRGGHSVAAMWLVAAVCCGMTMLAAAVPFLRAFYRVEVNYNEGWNVYNAVTVASHDLLYPAKYAWTTVNYPMLSFAVMAWLHRLTHEFLFTGRAISLLSLLGNGVLVGGIVYRLAGAEKAWLAGGLAAVFTVALFCANAEGYVGMDDPQMLAQVFFLAGLYVYLSRHVLGWDGRAAIACTALLFVVGGFIKHNPVDFPLAVLIDLLFISRWRALWFSAWGLGLVALGVALNVHYGGPHFIDQLLTPRVWSSAKAAAQLRDGLGPVLPLVWVAGYTAWRLRQDASRRVAAILLAAGLATGSYFGGGQGVAVNSLFSTMLATSILIGIFFCGALRLGGAKTPWRMVAVALIFLWLWVPLAISGNWNVASGIRQARAGEAQFDGDVEFIAGRPGPALCESLLRCYAAGKPYIYDPFNATQLIELGKLDQTELLQSIGSRRFGAIQVGISLDDPAAIDRIDPALRDRFTPEAIEAIRTNYVAAVESDGGVVYVPGRTLR